MTTTPNGNGFDKFVDVKKPDQIDLGGSITSNDILPGTLGMGFGGAWGGIANFYLSPYGGFSAPNNQLMPELPAYWSKSRDACLRLTMKFEPYWNGAVKKAIAKGVTQQWDLKFHNGNRGAAEKVRELFHSSNGLRGFKNFLIQHLQDYFLTDNGAFIEIDRQDNTKPGSRIKGLYHLDSLRCYRTGDPDLPVIYAGLDGTYRFLSWWQVWDISDTPNASNNYFGVGDCAAAGVYQRIRRMVAIRLYEYQKMTGDGPQELHFIQGITPQQLEQMLKSNDASRQARGMTVYKGAALIAMMTKDAIQHIQVPLAELPAKYDQNLELEQASIEYALALGVGKLDIRPLQGKMSGTATQSDVMEGQSDQSGLGLWSGSFEDFANNVVTPNSVSFFWSFNNTRSRKAKADADKAYIEAAGTLVEKVQMAPDKAQNWLVDNDTLDPSYLPTPDMTETAMLTEDDKPEVVAPTAPEVVQGVQQAIGQQVQQVATQVA